MAPAYVSGRRLSPHASKTGARGGTLRHISTSGPWLIERSGKQVRNAATATQPTVHANVAGWGPRRPLLDQLIQHQCPPALYPLTDKTTAGGPQSRESFPCHPPQGKEGACSAMVVLWPPSARTRGYRAPRRNGPGSPSRACPPQRPDISEKGKSTRGRRTRSNVVLRRGARVARGPSP